MNESEQAQVIEEIKDALKAGVILYSDVSAYLKTTLKIVDSQAQKIAQLTKERDEMTAAAYRLGSEAQQYISEARAEAEKWRQATIEYKYGNQWTQEGFALSESEKLPWEKR